MAYWQHHRTYDHRGTEDCSTVALSRDVGRYAAGTLLCEVLTDLDQRASWLATDYSHGFSVFTANAFIAPYATGDLAGGLLGVFGLNAMLTQGQTDTLSLDAEISVVGEVETSFNLHAYLVSLAANAIAQLAASIDATTTTITVTTATGFPTGGDYLIQIDNEIMLVVGGQGTTTWTVIRGYNGTTAAPHSAGALIADC